jgi:hypothetical protein
MMQEIRNMKKFLTAVALAALASSPALAKTHHSTAPTADEAYASSAAPDAVIEDGQVVGADPDPSIRFQILRDHGLQAD